MSGPLLCGALAAGSPGVRVDRAQADLALGGRLAEALASGALGSGSDEGLGRRFWTAGEVLRARAALAAKSGPAGGLTQLRAGGLLVLRASNGTKLPDRLRAIAYSGEVVRERGLVIDLGTLNVDARAPLLFNHDPTRVVGALSATTNDGRELVVEGRLYTGLDEAADSIAAKAQRGHKWQLSVGLGTFDTEAVNAGQSVAVNGRNCVGPLLVLRRGVVREVSIVAVGADAGTSAAVFGAGATR